jgi:hypothetical protein
MPRCNVASRRMAHRGLARRRSSVALVLSITSPLFLACASDLGFESPNHGTYFWVKPHPLVMLEGRSIALHVETDADVRGGIFRIWWRVDP